MNKYSSMACAGDLAQLVGLTHKHFIFSLKEGGDLQTHRGVLKHDELIGKQWGSQVSAIRRTFLFIAAFYRRYPQRPAARYSNSVSKGYWIV